MVKRNESIERLSAEHQEQDQRDQRIEQRRADEPAENSHRYRMQDFLAGFRRAEKQRDKRNPGS